MDDLVKFVSALPLPAAIAFGSVLAVIAWVSRAGIVSGMRSLPRNDAPSAQVAAMIVDPTALNNAANILSKHTVAIEELIDVGRGLARSVDHMTNEIDRIREEMRIQTELSRRN